jgi:hypothetical protein
MSVELVTDTPTLTASELIAASGATWRQVDWWTRAGYLKPSNKKRGTGTPNRYPIAEAQIAAYALELITAGFTASAALGYARTLVEDFRPIVLAAGLVEIGRRL